MKAAQKGKGRFGASTPVVVALHEIGGNDVKKSEWDHR
jgi:dienelactone hydrolase